MFKLGLLLMSVAASCLLCCQARLLTDKERQQLADSPLISIKLKDPSSATSRSMENTMKAFKKHCQCHGIICGCCTEIEVYFLSVQGCANITIIPEEKAFQVSLTAGDKHIIKHKVSAHQLEKVCGKVAAVKDLEICMFTTLDEDKPNELLSCMSLDISYDEILLANVNFQCLKYANKKLTFVENEKTNKEEALLYVKIRSPFELIAKIVKAAINQLEKS